ncbi:hypothetical protein F9K91_11935 [Brucella tritici]|uniref:Uncharacterized protein n=1 Tax=Brucella tritici TaxID=94626 RepID=A0A6L3YS45_9HYPH|nr:hypothetical protein F9K91_11935 [Brucella tritici]KAB2686371.1 hypothetical protein F9L08_10870 [Brucella tritici]
MLLYSDRALSVFVFVHVFIPKPVPIFGRHALTLVVLAKAAHQFAHLLNALFCVEAEGCLRLQR